MERVKMIIKVIAILCFMATTSCEWVDYPSGVRCCSDIAVESCEPGSKIANNACRDVCHYGGCRKGGQCQFMGWAIGHVCHCNC